ncbi:Integrin alpha ina-1 [Echinococcus granulosus]|uniref:Integrin alpha ina-1 n=1 Tax=Echinococcus granulosus TaxID=6210 RepID=W6UWK5_ECHGR|nr:Integrin alpha ina-1 [Echinococcus granulosus]EUB65016.1 Integrin alpha ina-1 [Echinococcus granulosus]
MTYRPSCEAEIQPVEIQAPTWSTHGRTKHQITTACSPRLSYEVTGNLFVTGGCFAFDNVLINPSFLGASSCLNIPEASRSIDLRFCLDGASSAYFHNTYTDLIVSGRIGLVNNVTKFNPVRKTDIAYVGDYSLLGSSSVLSDRVYSSASDSERPIVSVFGAPGVPQTWDREGSGFVVLNVIEKGPNQIVIPQVKVLHGNRFGSRFGHAVALIDLDCDGWDDLVVGAPFEQLPGTSVALQRDLDLHSVHSAPVFGCIYVFWNQRRHLPSTTAFDSTSVQVIWPPPSLSFKSGFGSSITSLGDIDHDGIDGDVHSTSLMTLLAARCGLKKLYQVMLSVSISQLELLMTKAAAPFLFTTAPNPGGSAPQHRIQPPPGSPAATGEGGLTGAVRRLQATRCQMRGKIETDKLNGEQYITDILNATELTDSMEGFGFSLSSGGLDLDNNGYPDLAVGAPNSDKIAVFRARPVIKLEIFVLREDGSSHIGERLDSLEVCTRDTQILPGYWAPRVHCMNMKVLATFTHLDPVPCARRTIPVRLLLTINPPDHWLNEEFTNKNSSKMEIPVASFFGEQVLKVGDPEVGEFYRRSYDAATPPANSDEVLPFLLLNSLMAVCREPGATNKPPSPAELDQATPVRLAFRDVDLVDLSSPIRFGVKWLLDAPSPSSPFADLINYPINNPRENTGQSLITFGNECESRKCNPILLPQFEYSVTRDRDGPVVLVGDDEFQSVEVKATVTNRGRDPSYATSVYASYPEELLDLSTNPHELNHRASLVRPGLALCHFGNPLSVGEGATCALRFKVLGQQLMKAPKNFTINSTITSSPKFPPKMLAPATDSITVKVKMSVNVSVTGEILPDAAYYSGNVTDGILINNGENKIGSTRLLIRVRVQNLRKHSLVPNSRLIIDWPYETADIITEENGKLLFYLLEKPYITKTDLPTASNTTIVCDSRALDRLVNPYNYRVFRSLAPQPRGDPVATAPIDLPSSHPTEYPPLKSNLEFEKMPDQGNVKRVSTTLSCYNGQLRCVPIVCDLGPLSYRTGILTFEMPARLWDNTMRQDFKDIFMTSVQLTATWRASVTFTIDAGDKDHTSDNLELKIFNDMEPEPVYPKNMPLYIGLAVFAGLLLLAILIIILWKAKFFERKKFKQRFQRTKPTPKDSKSGVPEARRLNISNPPPPRQASLHSPPISAYGDMNG